MRGTILLAGLFVLSDSYRSFHHKHARCSSPIRTRCTIAPMPDIEGGLRNQLSSGIPVQANDVSSSPIADSTDDAYSIDESSSADFDESDADVEDDSEFNEKEEPDMYSEFESGRLKKEDLPHLPGVYVLELENKCIYVGKSNMNVDARVLEHFNSGGSAFTKKFKPVRQLPTLTQPSTDLESFERAETLEQMWVNGIKNVRGWQYTKLYLSEFEYESVFRQMCERKDLCRKCGRSSHMMSSCNYNTLAGWIGAGNLVNREMILRGGDTRTKKTSSTIAALKSTQMTGPNSEFISGIKDPSSSAPITSGWSPKYKPPPNISNAASKKSTSSNLDVTPSNTEKVKYVSKKNEKIKSPVDIVYSTVGNRKQRRDNLFRSEAGSIAADINHSENRELDDDLQSIDAEKNIPILTLTSQSTSTSSDIKDEKIDSNVDTNVDINENKNVNAFQKKLVEMRDKVNSYYGQTVLMSFVTNFSLAVLFRFSLMKNLSIFAGKFFQRKSFADFFAFQNFAFFGLGIGLASVLEVQTILYTNYFDRKIGANAKDNMTKISRSSESIIIALAILRMTTYPIKTQYVFALDLFQTLFYCMAKFASQSYLTWGWLAGTDKRRRRVVALSSVASFFGAVIGWISVGIF